MMTDIIMNDITMNHMAYAKFWGSDNKATVFFLSSARREGENTGMISTMKRQWQ
jgi:hypothetical protein